MNTKEAGKIFGYLASAHDAATDPFVKRQIEQAIATLSATLEQKIEIYQELAEGIIESKVPLRLLTSICTLLPGNPMLAEVFGRSDGFYVKEKENIKTIIGINDNGKTLVDAMIEAVRKRAKKPENSKGFSKKT